jgi:spore germination protein GerM
VNWRPSRANLLTGAGLLVLLAVVVLTAPRWTRLLTRTVPGEDTAPEERREAREEEPAGAVERRINVKLFFQGADRPGLVMEERAVPFSGDLATQLKSVITELVQGSKSGLQPTLPPETKVLEVFVSARGTAYVDLSKEAVGTGGGSHDELIAVYSIVNSLVVNFPAVKRVQILVDDRPAETLAGHVDLTRPLTADMTLLAAAAVAPAGEPGAASPAPVASPAPRAAPRS